MIFFQFFTKSLLKVIPNFFFLEFLRLVLVISVNTLLFFYLSTYLLIVYLCIYLSTYPSTYHLSAMD